MKRVIAFVLSALLLVAYGTLIIDADDGATSENAETTSYESLGSGAVTLNCVYSADREKIELSGNVNYNILVSHGKYMLGILRIAPHQSVEDAICAESPDIAAKINIAAKFSFSLDIRSTADRVSKYAVVLISSEGDIILASEPIYISVPSGYSYMKNHRDEFKGAFVGDTAEVSVYGDMGFGTAIIPVYYNRLINTSMNGYIFSHEDGHLFFDKAYIDELDAKIRTYSVSGARVYLQLLMPTEIETGENSNIGYESYMMPDVYDAETLSTVYTYVKFLVSRYRGYVDGQIGGIIVGKQIDKRQYNSSDIVGSDEYAEKYALYVSVVAAAARLENPDMDIVVPFSDLDCYEIAAEIPRGDHLPSNIIEKISSVFDRYYSDGLDFSIMIESGAMPVSLVDNDGEYDGKYSVIGANSDLSLGITELYRLNSYLQSIERIYRSAPSSYIFYWNVPDSAQGDILECSYAYIYYSLLKNSRSSSFVISFDDGNFDSFDAIRKTVGLIDTAAGVSQCEGLLNLFGVNSWNDIVEDYSTEGAVVRTEYLSDNVTPMQDPKGSFAYFDFSTGDLSDWYGGTYSKSIKADYGEGGYRVLRQTVGRAIRGAHSDLFCIYEYDENFIYTPLICLKMKISDGEVSSGALYEVTVTVGTKNSFVSRTQTVSSGQSFDMWLDVGEYAQNNMTSYIKISTRSITGETDEYSLWVNDISGYSSKYDSEELNKLISEARHNIRNQTQNNDGIGSDSVVYWIVFAIILVAVVIGGVLMIVLRRDDTKKIADRANKFDNK